MRGAAVGEVLPAVARERRVVVLVGELGVRDRELAAQRERLVGADRVQALVGLGVDARDEEARDRCDRARVAAALHEPLEPADVGLGDRRVALEREDQRDVDRAALRDALLDRAEPGLGGGDLHERVRAVDPLVQAERLVDRRLLLVGELGVDLDRDVAVLAAARVPDRAQQVAGIAGCPRPRAGGRSPSGRTRRLRTSRSWSSYQSLRGDRLLEDRGVGRDADDGVLAHQPRELAGLEPFARERVDPDALAQLAQPVEVGIRHGSIPSWCARACVTAGATAEPSLESPCLRNEPNGRGRT